MDWVDVGHFGNMKNTVLGDELKTRQIELKKQYSILKLLINC